MKPQRTSFSIIIIFIALSLAGLSLLPLLPVKLFPSRELPSLSVDFSMPGASSRIVEQEVTGKLEGALARIEGIRKIESRSCNGGGSVRLELDRNTDMAMARLEAATIVRQLWGSLPEGVSYPAISTGHTRNEAAGPFMTYTVTSPGSSTEIESYLTERVLPILSDIKGVGSVDIYGAVPMEWRIEYDADRLVALGMTPSEIASAIRRQSSSGHSHTFNPHDVTVTSPSGERLTLDRLVKVVRREGKPQSYFRINGMNSLYIAVTADDDANQLDTSDRVAEAIKEIASHAPQGMSFIIANDNTDTIREELHKIWTRTTLTVIILLVFIVAVTRNVRYTLLIVISLAINLCVAVIFYRIFSTEIQLYSLAGITISLNLVIDNIIVMGDHYLRRGDRRAFPAILAATLTTAGALVVVFLLNEEVRLNLEDFVIVVAVNLLVSLAVALFLVPALAGRMGCKATRKRDGMPAWLTHIYASYIRFALRWRPIFLILMAGGIGWSGWVFFQKVRDGHYFDRDKSEPMLYVSASLPNGATIEQMDLLIRRMETFLSGEENVRMFQTNVSGANRAYISIRFTPEAAGSGYPHQLQNMIISKALSLGGGSWNVYGLEEQGFSNEVRESAGNMRVKMYGFNYDELTRLGEELRDTLLANRRIKGVEMNSDFSYFKTDYSEFRLVADREALAKSGITVEDFYSALSTLFGRDIDCGYITTEENQERLWLSSRQSRDYDVWALMNMPVVIKGKSVSISELASLDKVQSPQDIVKENRSYRLCLQYEYIGSTEQANRSLDRILEKLTDRLPAGYSANKEKRRWEEATTDYSRYLLLGVIAAIIFFLSAILFNSLRRPLAIIAVIPMSYVGIFLTFTLFDLKFDQGGFASFILLSGITVNAAIYIINEFDNIRKHTHESASETGTATPSSTDVEVEKYLEAFKVKIMPVITTVVSTILGFIPFMAGTGRESFWFPLAAGTIGGLLLSLIVIVLYLPLLVIRHSRGRKGGHRITLHSKIIINWVNSAKNIGVFGNKC